MKTRLFAARPLGACVAVSLAFAAAVWLTPTDWRLRRDLPASGRPTASPLRVTLGDSQYRPPWLPALASEPRLLLVSYAGDQSLPIPALAAVGPELVPPTISGDSSSGASPIAPVEEFPQPLAPIESPERTSPLAVEQLEDTLDASITIDARLDRSNLFAAAEALQDALDAAPPPAAPAAAPGPLWSMDAPPQLPDSPPMPLGSAKAAAMPGYDAALPPAICPLPPVDLPPVDPTAPAAASPIDPPPAEAPRLLLPPEAVQSRSREMELLAREADLHTQRAFELAGRKAYFSARAEFVASLRLVAQGLDNQCGADRHSRALAAGLTALDEAGDFMPRGRQLEADLDLESIVAGHRTPVLKEAAGRIAPVAAMTAYFTFAQEQLSLAAGNEVAASMALYGLARLHSALGDESNAVAAAKPKAMAFCQAAILAAPGNYLASNELGVLLAQGGRYDEARLALEHSLSICSQSPAVWRNLGIVYQRLGDRVRAERAQGLARQMAGAPAAGAAPAGSVRWLAPEAFSRTLSSPPGMAASPRQSAPVRK